MGSASLADAGTGLALCLFVETSYVEGTPYFSYIYYAIAVKDNEQRVGLISHFIQLHVSQGSPDWVFCQGCLRFKRLLGWFVFGFVLGFYYLCSVPAAVCNTGAVRRHHWTHYVLSVAVELVS